MTAPTQILRPLPMHYCNGCGHTVLHRLLASVLDEQGLASRAVGVCGVGCSFMMYEFLDLDFVAAPPGKAMAVAMGLKSASPDSAVFTYQGDADAGASVADLVAAAAAGIAVTAIVVDNQVTGLSGPHPTAPVLPGVTGGPHFDLAQTIAAVARPKGTVARTHLAGAEGEAHTRALLTRSFRAAEQGSFSLLQVVSACPTHWGLSPEKAQARISDELSRSLPAMEQEPLHRWR